NKKESLMNHNVRLGESYIYEDFEFYIRCSLRASRVPIIPNILYKVRVHDQSTTKTEHNSLKHRNSFLAASDSSSKILHEGTRNEESVYHTNKYFIHRALLYAEKRLPNSKKIRDDFIYQTMKIINEYSPNIKITNKNIPLYFHSFKKNYEKDY